MIDLIALKYIPGVVKKFFNNGAILSDIMNDTTFSVNLQRFCLF